MSSPSRSPLPFVFNIKIFTLLEFLLTECYVSCDLLVRRKELQTVSPEPTCLP